MTDFLINGVLNPLPISSDDEFGKLLQHLNSHLVDDNSLISSIKINGIEIGEEEEKELGPVPLEQLRSIEVRTLHPLEMAKDTLATLTIYTQRLAELSRQTADERHPVEAVVKFQKLVAGIETFVEAVTTLKDVATGHDSREVVILEAQLLSIMQGLLQAESEKNSLASGALLREKLPENLRQWREVALPSLTAGLR
jgi:hypothetical protein